MKFSVSALIASSYPAAIWHLKLEQASKFWMKETQSFWTHRCRSMQTPLLLRSLMDEGEPQIMLARKHSLLPIFENDSVSRSGG